MLKEIVGDIFEEFEAKRINVLVHQANCFHTMGGGIARVIAERYPVAAEVDRGKTLRGDKDKLGTYSIAKLPDGRRIVNVYSQFDTSAMMNTQEDIRDTIEEAMADTGRATRYDAVDVALRDLEEALATSKLVTQYVLGIPYGYGSDLAGGSWTIVRAIIESVFAESPVKVIIVKLPTAKLLR
jgi:hypothetical protein